MCLFPFLLLSSILFGIYFTSVHIIQSNRTFSFAFFLHTRTPKISDVIPNGNETNLHPKNEVCIPHASLLFNLWKPESESAFLLITDLLLLAALSQCLWLCPGFSVNLGAQLIQLFLTSLYLQHHFAALWPAVNFLSWCFPPIVQVWTSSLSKYKEYHCCSIMEITATFSIERDTICLGNLDRKPKERGQRFMKWGCKGGGAALVWMGKKKQGSGGSSRKVTSVLCEKRKENLA